MQKSLRYKSKKANRVSRNGPRHSFWGWRFLTVLAFLVLIVGLAFANIELAKRREKLRGDIGGFEKQFEYESSANNQINDFVGNSPASLERVAREELNLRKAGETVVAFPEKIEEDIDKTDGLLQKIKDKLK